MRTTNMDNQNKEKETKGMRTNFSREFTNKYDEIDKLTEQAYSNLT